MIATKEKKMTEEIALSKCTGFIDCNSLLGYLPFEAANFLVGTRKYAFYSAGCWGYVLEKL